MFIWNINALIQQLKTNSVSAYEQAQYYSVIMFLYLFESEQAQIRSLPTENNESIMYWFIATIMLLGGIAYCYKINKKVDNKDFMLRMITLSFVAKTRFAVFLLAFMLMLFGLLGILNLYADLIEALKHTNSLTTAFHAIIYVVVHSVYYWYLGKQFKKIAESPESMVDEYYSINN